LDYFPIRIVTQPRLGRRAGQTTTAAVAVERQRSLYVIRGFRITLLTQYTSGLSSHRTPGRARARALFHRQLRQDEGDGVPAL